MWQTGSVNPGYEHFMTNLFRNRLITAIDAVSDSHTKSPGRVLLFLPENELHELPLLFYSWVVRKMGYEIIYIGQMNPLGSVIPLSEKWDPDFIITGMVTGVPRKPLDYLKELAAAFKGKKILIAGTLAPIALKASIQNIIPIRSLGELKANMSGSSPKVQQ
jgi:hypothetical protein